MERKLGIVMVVAVLFMAAVLSTSCDIKEAKEEFKYNKSLEALNSKEPEVRERAAYALAEFKENNFPADPLLGLIEGDESDDVRVAAIWTASKLEYQKAKVDKVLLKALADENPDIRYAVLEAWQLSHWDDGRTSIFIDHLKDKSPQVRQIAASSLSPYMDEYDEEVISALKQVLSDPDYEVRLAAALSLSWYESGVEEAVPILIDAFDDPVHRFRAVLAIGHLGAKADEAVPLLMNIINSVPRTPALWSLVESAKPGADLLELLRNEAPGSDILAELEHMEIDHFEWPEELARFGIWQFKAHWANGKQELIFILDLDHSIRREAVRSLAAINPTEDTASFLIGLLKDSDEALRSSAAWALGAIGESGAIAVPELIKSMSEDEDSVVRSAAAYSLGELQQYSEAEIVPVLIKALEDKVMEVKKAATIGLGKAGTDAKAAIPVLTGMLEDYTTENGERDIFLDREVAETLVRIGPEEGDYKAFLIEMLGNDSAPKRLAAVETLGKLGPDIFAAYRAPCKR